MASKAQHAGTVISPAATVAKAQHGGLSLAPVGGAARASHGGLIVYLTGGVARARHAGLTLSSAAASAATAFIMTAAGLVPLGRDQTTPSLPGWPYGALGAYKPGPTTSGVPDDAVLPVLVGDQTITTAGTVIEGMEIQGRVLVRAANVTIRGCRIVGPSSPLTIITGLVTFEHSAALNGLIEDSTVRPQAPSDLIDGIRGHDFTARRNNVSATTDGFGIMNTTVPGGPYRVHIEGNYVHDLSYMSTTSQADGHTHNDGIQIHGGSDIWIVGNNIQGFTDPAVSNLANPYASSGNQITGQVILAQTTISNLDNIHILDNWMDGGGEAGIVHGTAISPKTHTNLEVKRNKAGTNQRTIGGVKYTVRVQTVVNPVDIPLTGPDANIFEATGSPVTVVRY